MVIAQDTCSNENNTSVYVQQIFQKYEHRIGRIGPKKHVRTRYISLPLSKAWRLLNIWINKI